MSDFNKLKYDIMYNATKMNKYCWTVSNDERKELDAHCTKIDSTISAYLKKLVNDDLTKQGLEPIFKRVK